MRKKRGRRQRISSDSNSAEAFSCRPISLPSYHDFNLSIYSRDSGVLSVVFDDVNILDVPQGNHTNQGKPLNRLSSFRADSISSLLDREMADTNSRVPSTLFEAHSSCACRSERIMQVLREWVAHFPADFRNKKIMSTLNDVMRRCQAENKDLNEICCRVADDVSRRITAQERYEQQLFDMEYWDGETHQSVRDVRGALLKYMLTLQDAADVNSFARQLTIIEMDFLKHIGTEEFLQMFTADSEQDTRTNLGASVRWFNRLSHLVATLICMCRKRKDARHIIKFFIRVAERCYQINNFNSSMSIWTGLNSGAVTRLHRIWSKISLPEWHKLQKIFDPSNNFQHYREIFATRSQSTSQMHSTSLHAQSTVTDISRYSILSQHSISSAVSSDSLHHQGDSGIECDHDVSATSSNERLRTGDDVKDDVIVPFLVLLVKDIYFLNHSIPTVRKDGKVNLEKLRRLSHILHPLESWKQRRSIYEKNEQVRDFFLNTPVWDDDELYLASYKREAPINRYEKGQLKHLKAANSKKKERDSVSSRRASKCKTI